MGIWVIVCIQEHLPIFCRPFVHYACLRLCSAIVQLIQNNFLFCLLWLISACADHDRIAYITNFCSMIELLHELEDSSPQHRSIQAFDNVSARKKEN